MATHELGGPPAKRERIFERFYQAHEHDPGARGTSGAALPGMGLGLYITRQIVELHGGRIWHEAPPDGGSRFVVELPLHAFEAPTEALTAAPVTVAPATPGTLRAVAE